MKHTPIFSNHRFDLLGIVLLIILLILIVFSWPAPASGSYQDQVAATPTPTLALPTTTAIPQKYLQSNDQTNGIICGSVALVLIIVGGTLGILRSKNGKVQ